MPRPDKDMHRISELFSEARSIANRRDWPSVTRGLDHAQTALLRVKPNDGEEGGTEFRPTFEIRETEPKK